MKFLKQFMFGVLAIVTLMLGVMVRPTEAYHCENGVEVKSAAACAQSKDEDRELFGDDGVISSIINVILGAMGVVAVVVIIVGGIQYMTSAGDGAKAAKARNMIMYGVIGLVISVLAFAIVNFVIANSVATK